MKRTRSNNLENLEKQRILLNEKIFILQKQLDGVEKSIIRLQSKNKQSSVTTDSSVSGFNPNDRI